MATMHEGVFYLGSDSNFHHFVVKFKLSTNRYLKVSKKELDLSEPMKISRDENTWLSLFSTEQGGTRDGYKIIFLKNGRKYLIEKAPNQAIKRTGNGWLLPEKKLKLRW